MLSNKKSLLICLVGVVRHGISIASLVLLLASCSGSNTDLSIDHGDPVVGKNIYLQSCAACHGEQLQGQPDWRVRLANGLLPAPPHDASGHTWHHSDDLLFEYTKYGGAGVMERKGLKAMKSGMPAFGMILNDQQIMDVLAFIRSNWPPDIRSVQRKRNENNR